MPNRILDQRWPWLAVAVAILIAFGVTSFESGDGRPVGSADDIAALKERSDLNVFLILIDTLRADHLGAYGYERDTSPHLDRIASSGARFAHHLSQSSWTKTSMASLWTGMYPARTGILRFDHVIPDDARMPAEILKDAGFHTVGIFRNGWVDPTFGFSQGFDSYYRPPSIPPPPEVRARNPTLTTRGTDESVVESAMEFLRIRGGQRWFLYLHLMDVHEYLYDDESALFGGGYADNYDNSIRWTDETLRILWEYLREGGYLENTIIAVASDHGEAFRERGLEGHARDVFRESTEVPFLLSLPFRLSPGLVVDARTENVDVWPTLLDLIGVEIPPDVDGRSLVPDLLASMRGEVRADSDPAIAHLDQAWARRIRDPASSDAVAVVEGSHRYVSSHRRGHRVEQLFDAASDPDELHDLSTEDSETLERLRLLADTYLEMESPWGEPHRREVSELELNHLRALGYAIP